MTFVRSAAWFLAILSLVLYFRDLKVRQSSRNAAFSSNEPFNDDDDVTFDDVDSNLDDTDDFGTASERRRAHDEFDFEKDYDNGDDDDDDEFYSEDNDDFFNEDDFDAPDGKGGSHRLLIRFDDTQFTSQFETVRNMLQRYFPQLRHNNIRGEKYPVPAVAQTIATVMSFLPMILVALTFGGNFLTGLGVPHELIEEIKAKRMYILPAFMVLNMFIRPRLTNTGAFEVVYNGAVVHSTLKNGVLPVGQDMEQLFTALSAAGLTSSSNFRG